MNFKHLFLFCLVVVYIEASTVGRIRRRVPERTSDTVSLKAKVSKNSAATNICIAQFKSTKDRNKNRPLRMLCIDQETNNIYALKCQEKQQKSVKRLVDAIGKCDRHYNRQDLWPSSDYHPDISHSVVDKERLDQLRRPEVQDHLEELQSTCSPMSGIEFTNNVNFSARVFCYRKNGQNILYFKNKRPETVEVISKKIWVI